MLLEELSVRSLYLLLDRRPPIPPSPWWNVIALIFNWRCEWELKEVSRDSHHMHMAYFHHDMDHRAENEWIINSHFMEISEAIEAKDLSYLSKYRVLAWRA